MNVKSLKIADLKHNDKNPRTIDKSKLERLVKSLQDFPEMLKIRPLVIDSDNVVLGGNMRLQAAKKAGLKELPTICAGDLTEEQKNEFIIKDNVGFGEWDYTELNLNWDAQKLTDWGMDLPDFKIDDIDEDDIDVQEDKIQTKIILGDLIEIGNHRLLCGDSADTKNIEYLMNNSKCEIAFTSPPYNASKTPSELKNKKSSKYIDYADNKTEDDYCEFLKKFTKKTLEYCDYSFVNLQHIAGNKIALINYLYAMKTEYADTLIWNKLTAQPAMGENILNSQFEYIFCFSKKANRNIGSKKFRGTLSNVIDIQKQTKNEFSSHSATFPIELSNFFVKNFSENSVMDLFCGTGTTIVSCQQLKRKCYAIEISPIYCQVIIDRMIKLFPEIDVKINGIKYESNE